MATRVEQLIDELVTQIEANPNVAVGSVYSSRVETFADTELPAYNIEIGADTPLNPLGPDNVAFIDWAQSIFIDLYAKSTAVDINGIFLDMRNNVHTALMDDVTQGLAFIMTTIPGGADEPVLDSSGEQKTITYRTAWEFRLRTDIDSLE